MAPDQHILISYSGPKFFLGTQKWNIFYQSLASQFPLQNVHWRSSFRNQILRTIPSLDVRLIALASVRDELASQIPTTVLEKPILHVYVAYCEDHDLDTYKAMKREIKEWTNVISQKKNPEWLILQIVTPDQAKQTRSGLFGGSVLEKLKTDFNQGDKRTRCAQVSYSPNTENRLLWAEFHNIVKECLGYALDHALAARYEDVKRLESQQHMPGWNFCTFFILKESLALSYEGISVFEEAHSQYQDLEASFVQVSKERNMSWFGSLMSPEAGEDSAPLLSPGKKPYRDLILSNKISIFELRSYILARQCQLMAKLGQVEEVPKKVANFLGTFSKTLKQIQESLPQFFIQSWIYSAAEDAINQCEVWKEKYPPKNVKRLEAGIGELRDLGRSQLDIIGIELQYLPKQAPFSMSISGQAAASSAFGSGTITNPRLLEALGDRDVFYDLYISLTNDAIARYAKADRGRFAVKLYGYLAALDLHRGNLDRALDTYCNLASHYAPHTWVSMESYMFSRALDIHKSLEKDRDTEWIHRILSFLKAYVENNGAETLLSHVDVSNYVATFVNEIKEAAAVLENDIRYPDHPALSIKVAKHAKLASDRDGSTLEVTVSNHLPCPFPADEVTVTLSGRDFEKFQFSSSTGPFPPGQTKLTLSCPNPTNGSFFVESSEIRATKLLLQYPQKKGSTSSQHLVRIESDPLALNIRVFQSRKVELGKPFSVSFRIWTGRNAVEKLSLRISAPSATFRYRDATIDDEDSEAKSETTQDSFNLEGLAKDSIVRFSIPYSEAVTTQMMRVEVEVDYNTVDEPETQRNIRFASNISPSLPISVRVQDWFRDSRLISTFSVKSTTHQYIRVATAKLISEAQNEVKVVPCNVRQGTITVTPNENANFLFALDSITSAVNEPLIFEIKYRLLREEVGNIVEDEIKAALDEASESQDLRPVLIDKVVKLLENDSSWVSLYNITGEFDLPIPPKGDDDRVNEMLVKSLERLRKHRHPETPQGIWRELRLPVDVPVKSIVASAGINILSTHLSTTLEPGTTPSLYAGQPINAELVIRTTFRWGAKEDTARKYLLNYQIEDMTREWLIGGVKQGDFIAQNDGVITVPLTLMALHHGEFGLPQVSIRPRINSRELTVGSQAPPSVETYQEHGAVKVLVLPRGGRSTFIVAMGSPYQS